MMPFYPSLLMPTSLPSNTTGSFTSGERAGLLVIALMGSISGILVAGLLGMIVVRTAIIQDMICSTHMISHPGTSLSALAAFLRTTYLTDLFLLCISAGIRFDPSYWFVSIFSRHIFM